MTLREFFGFGAKAAPAAAAAKPREAPKATAGNSVKVVARNVTTAKPAAKEILPLPAPQNSWKYQVLPINALNLPIIKYHIQPQLNLDVCIVELKPQIRKIYDQYNINHKVVRYVSFPYTVFLVCLYFDYLAEIYNYFSDIPINGPQSPLFFPCLSNTTSMGCVCYGDDVEKQEINARLAGIPSLRGKVVEVIDEYWRTSFTNHLAQTHLVPWGIIDPRIASYESWEKTTQKDPDFILTVPWHRRSAGTVEYILKYRWRE